jgi:hypothetical protein
MSLEGTIQKLKGISDEAKELFEVLRDLAKQQKDVTAKQKDKIKKLVDRLDKTSREAARERRRAEIQRLTEVIEAHDLSLTVPGLSSAAREAIRADRVAKLARRARLRAQEGTDFGGILTAREAGKIVDVAEKARKEVRTKKRAAAFLESTVKIADLALTIAGKLAA